MTEAAVTKQFHFNSKVKGRKEILEGKAAEKKSIPEGRVPRVSKLMALAIHFESLIYAGGITDQAELARVGHVSRARVTQIMNLLLLAPDIQEGLLFLPRTMQGRDPIRERMLRPICAERVWEKQRKTWRRLTQ